MKDVTPIPQKEIYLPLMDNIQHSYGLGGGVMDDG